MNIVTPECSSIRAINGRSEHKFKMEFMTELNWAWQLSMIDPENLIWFKQTGSISWYEGWQYLVFGIGIRNTPLTYLPTLVNTYQREIKQTKGN